MHEQTWVEARVAIGRFVAVWLLIVCMAYRMLYWVEVGDWPILTLYTALSQLFSMEDWAILPLVGWLSRPPLEVLLLILGVALMVRRRAN